MQLSKIHVFICQFLAIILLLSGMCYYSMEAHSLFAYGFTNQNEHLERQSNQHVSQKDCIPETPEERLSESTIHNMEVIRLKSVFDLSLPLYLLNTLSQNFINHFITILNHPRCEGLSNTVIVSFIHYSDGKK